jgi:hypothetical protein
MSAAIFPSATVPHSVNTGSRALSVERVISDVDGSAFVWLDVHPVGDTVSFKGVAVCLTAEQATTLAAALAAAAE